MPESIDPKGASPSSKEGKYPWEVPSAGYAFRFHLAGIANAYTYALEKLPARVPIAAQKDFADATYHLLYYLSDKEDWNEVAATYSRGDTGRLLLLLQDRATRLKAQNDPRLQAYLNHQREIASTLPKNYTPNISLYCASDLGNLPVVAGDRLPAVT